MDNLSLKYLLKRGVKKTSENLLRNIIAVLLLSVSAILFAYSETFFLFDSIEIESRFLAELNESDYKYVRVYSDDESIENSKERYISLPDEAFSYLDKTVPYIKYTNFTMSGLRRNSINYSNGVYFCVINSAADLLSYGYSFHGEYKENLSDGEIYISDIYLKEEAFYLLKDGEFERQSYQDSTDKSADWFSEFVGEEIYLESYEPTKVKIAGVVNTGAYSLTFRDVGLEGEDVFGNDLKKEREAALEGAQKLAIECSLYCTKAFLRSYIVEEGQIIVGSEFFQRSGVKTIKEDFSVSLIGENSQYIGRSQKLTVSNTVSISNADNRQELVPYADEEGIHYPYSYVENDICGEGEIMLSDGLYRKLYDEEYSFSKKLPSHIGEKISISITVDGTTYEIKDKTLVGVTEDFGYVDDGNWLGIICPDDEVVNQLMADYITMHYTASINIGGMSQSKLSDIFHTLKNKYSVSANIYNVIWDGEQESVELVKSIYFAISLGTLVISVLFECWTVLHTVKQDYREIGILRANGVTSKDLAIIYGLQFLIIGFVSLIISLFGLNILFLNYVPSDLNVVRVISYFPELKLYWVGPIQVLSLIILNLIVPFAVSLFAFFKVRKISPVEAINEAKRNE